ncbi:MAG: hypothetical protein M1826_005483, partial [Phylliscum demangeonii]
MVRPASARERYAVHQMHGAGLSPQTIATHFQWNVRRVQYLLKQPVTPGPRKGRAPRIDSPTRKRLTETILDNEIGAKRLSVPELAKRFGVGRSGAAIRSAL